jgi:hypothetical protein
MQDETILYNPASRRYCVLNRSAAVLWNGLEMPRTEEDLAELLCASFSGVSPDVARADVETTLAELRSLSLVHPVS